MPTSLLKDLVLKQKKAIRIVNNSNYNAHTEPIFKKLEILTLYSQLNFNKRVFIQSSLFNHSPVIFRNRWIKNRDRRAASGDLGPDLRNDNDLHEPFSCTEFISRLPFFNLPKLWNDLPAQVNIHSNIHDSKTFLKVHLLGKLNDAVVCNRLLCPTCHLGR